MTDTVSTETLRARLRKVWFAHERLHENVGFGEEGRGWQISFRYCAVPLYNIK